MKNELQPQLEQIKDLWDKLTVVPDDLTTMGFSGITKSIVSDALGGLIEVSGQLVANSKYEPLPVSKAALQVTLTSLQLYIASHIPSNPQPHIPGMLSLVEQARNTLQIWLDEADPQGKQYLPNLAKRLAESISSMKDAVKLRDFIVSSQNEVQELVTKAKTDSTDLTKSKDEIVANQGAISASAQQITTYSQQAKADAEQIKTLVADLTTLKEQLDANKLKQSEIFSKFEAHRSQVDNLLGDANRTGMAASFIARKQELMTPLIFWAIIFGASIISLASIAVLYVAPALTTENWQQLIFRLPLTAPVIWLGWFAAKQYGYTVRLREDYSYKVASAMSFEGFKREASDAGKEMQQKLLDTSIKNFGDNPLRIYHGHDNHASPTQEFLERSLKDEKLMDSLKAIFAKIKG